MEKVIVGMSGGVDSAMSAALLQKTGYDVTGVHCRFFDNDDAFIKEKSCCSLDDTLDARAVADKLGIAFHVFNFTDDFRRDVIDNFVNTYLSGGTPNPCIECNRKLKFDKLLNRAQSLGIPFVATGHYAQIEHDGGSGRYLLKKGTDETKDQSYVLYCLNQSQLSHTLFPLGGFTKSQVRQMAAELGFVNAKKRDSQDICFIPDGDYGSFIEKRIGKSFLHGEFVDTGGNVLGEHKGLPRYTIGQRRGLGLALKAPLYVKCKDEKNNRVVLCPNEELFASSLDAANINLIPFDKIDGSIKVTAKTRYKQLEVPAVVTQTENDRLHVEFEQPVRAISKGQAVVLYDGEYVIGGGTIL